MSALAYTSLVKLPSLNTVTGLTKATSGVI